MPFSTQIIETVGRLILVQPRHGFGWRLTESNRLITELEQVPEAFQAKVTDILYDKMDAIALVGIINVSIQGHHFDWGYFGARTDLFIDLREREIGCNVLLSSSKPFLSEIAKYPEPEHICTESQIQLRGYGIVALVPVRG